jgi:hypothetical protein
MNEFGDYKNKDLISSSGKTFKSFCDSIKLPEIEDKFIDKLEWGLMLLNNPSSMMRYNESIKPFNIKSFDGAWLFDIEKLGNDNLQFLFGDEKTLYDMIKICKNINVKLLNLSNIAYVRHIKYMNDIEKRPFIKKSRFMCELQYGFYSSKAEKWFLTNAGMRFDKFHGDYITLKKAYDKVVGIIEEIKMNEINAVSEDEIKNYEAKIDKTAYDELHKNLINQGYIFNDPFPVYFPLDYRFYYDKYAIDKNIKESIGTYLDNVFNIIYAVIVSFTAYFEWFVYIRENDNSIGIKIPIHPESFNDIFELRNIPEGAERKKAILHYVKSHYRRHRVETYNMDERLVYVKKYLRGETKFNWRGLQVNIIPSQDDVNILQSKKKFMEV